MTLSAAKYHSQTSYSRRSMEGGFLDWSNRPSVYKKYRGLKTVQLPGEAAEIETPFSDLIYEQPDSLSFSPDLETVTRLLVTACRPTASARFQGEAFYYLNAPSAGALYPCELYVAAQSVKGVSDGLYHYDSRSRMLTVLRGESVLETEAENPCIVLFITVIFFRSSWKYRERSYRYHLLDSGHLMESCAFAAKACRLPYMVSYDFDDAFTNQFLGVDDAREGCLAVIGIPDLAYRMKEMEPIPENVRNSSQVAEYSVSYPVMESIHRSSAAIGERDDPPEDTATEIDIPVISESAFTDFSSKEMNTPYEKVMTARRSRRNFIPEQIDSRSLNALPPLFQAEGKGDVPWRKYIAAGFIAGDVGGINPGVYLISPSKGKIRLIKEGAFINAMTHICLDQNWLRNAGLLFFTAADPEALDKRWGPRGYRYAMLSAGRVGHRIYLGATALKLGCCGVGAFYDDEAATLIGLGQSYVMLYLLAVGHVKK